MRSFLQLSSMLFVQDAQEKGWLLDGYPRSDDQAKAIIEAGIHPDIFIIIEVRGYSGAWMLASLPLDAARSSSVVCLWLRV